MRKKIIYYGLFLAGALLAESMGFAQPSGTDSTALRAFLTKIRQAYTQNHLLDFNIRYYYANADRPGVYLDSLAGSIQMDQSNCRMTLDGIETVLTGKYAIQINNTEKTIYLASANRAAAANPVGMVDTILSHIQGVTVAVTKKSREETLSLDFPPDQAYSRISILIDSKTGFLQRISYALNTAMLVSKEMISSPGNPSPYQSRGNMDILFSDYRSNTFDANLFREDNFITRVAPGQFTPAGRYRNYHIYLASSNL